MKKKLKTNRLLISERQLAIRMILLHQKNLFLKIKQTYKPILLCNVIRDLYYGVRSFLFHQIYNRQWSIWLNKRMSQFVTQSKWKPDF